MDKYISPSTIQKTYEVSTKTLRDWDNEGKVETVRTPGGWRLYKASDVDKLFQRENASLKLRKKVCYARVSSAKQRDDLERQIQDLKEKNPHHDIISDIGSGVNFERKGLRKLLDQAFNHDIEEVVVMHKDRLARIGFEILEYILKKHDVRVVVQGKELQVEDEQRELSDDLISVVTLFVARHNGKRAAENRRKRKRTSQEEKEGKHKRQRKHKGDASEISSDPSLSEWRATTDVAPVDGGCAVDL